MLWKNNFWGAVGFMAIGLQCQAAPLLFTNSGAGTVGIIAGSGVSILQQNNSNIYQTKGNSASDVVIGFVNTSVDFQLSGPTVDQGVVDFSGATLSKSVNCNGNAGSGYTGPNPCYVNAQSAVSNSTITGGAENTSEAQIAANEMLALSNAWYSATGANVSLNNCTVVNNVCTISATAGNLQTVSITANGKTWSETAYVFNITDNGPNPGHNIVINGSGSTLVVLNYKSSTKFQLNHTITLSGGITQDQVLLNLNTGAAGGTGTILQTSGGAVIDADIASVSGNVNLDNLTLNGRLFIDGTGTSSIQSGFAMTVPGDAPPAGSSTPEPATLFLLGGALIGLSIYGRRLRTTSPR